MTACGHAGVINTIRQAQRLTGVDRIHAVMGGFHTGFPGVPAENAGADDRGARRALAADRGPDALQRPADDRHGDGRLPRPVRPQRRRDDDRRRRREGGRREPSVRRVLLPRTRLGRRERAGRRAHTRAHRGARGSTVVGAAGRQPGRGADRRHLRGHALPAPDQLAGDAGAEVRVRADQDRAGALLPRARPRLRRRDLPDHGRHRHRLPGRPGAPRRRRRHLPHPARHAARLRGCGRLRDDLRPLRRELPRRLGRAPLALLGGRADPGRRGGNGAGGERASR